MSVRVKCGDVGCEKCSKGTHYKDNEYYCKTRKCTLQRQNAKECALFRCKGPDEYYCKTCRGGK